MTNFKKTLIVETSNNKVYDALTNSIAKWWTEMYEGVANEQGKNFTIRFGPDVFKTMNVEELIPDKKVVWYVVDSKIDLPDLKNKTEWVNTKIVWEIESLHHQTIINLTHFGLTPQLECFDICANGWQHFADSLKLFLLTGKGRPFEVS